MNLYKESSCSSCDIPVECLEKFPRCSESREYEDWLRVSLGPHLSEGGDTDQSEVSNYVT